MSAKAKNRSIDDPLWKSVPEQTFTHFLTFFFPEAEKLFDFTKKFVYLDKELQSMAPPKPHNKGVRYVDKLVRVPLSCSSAHQEIYYTFRNQSRYDLSFN